MRSGLPLGARDELVWDVAAEHAIHLGYPPPSLRGDQPPAAEGRPDRSVAVFSTPFMILLMERAARKVLEPFLDPGEVSVGASVNIEHLAGTPIGARVRGVAQVTAVDGRSVDFDVAAYDDQELIGRGTHRRAVVPVAKIAQRIAAKAARVAQGGQPPTYLDGIAGLPISVPPQHDRPVSRSQPPADKMGNNRSAAPGNLPVTDTIRVEIDGGIATVTLDRPAKKNAVNVRMTEDWERLIAYFAAHPEIRVVILTGAGEAFCAGDDVPEVGSLSAEQAQELSYRQARVYLSWEQLPQVFLAAIDGVALGAGCVAASACDLRIASYRSQLGMPEVWLGWPPGYGIAQLTALIGKSRALEVCLTGAPVTARKAHEWGWVHRLVPPGTLLREARQWAEELLRLPAAALRETKRAIHADEGLQPKTAFLNDTAAYIRCLQTADAREGIAAFVEKRPARFNG